VCPAHPAKAKEAKAQQKGTRAKGFYFKNRAVALTSNEQQPTLNEQGPRFKNVCGPSLVVDCEQKTMNDQQPYILAP